MESGLGERWLHQSPQPDSPWPDTRALARVRARLRSHLVDETESERYRRVDWNFSRYNSASRTNPFGTRNPAPLAFGSDRFLSRLPRDRPGKRPGRGRLLFSSGGSRRILFAQVPR